MLAHAVSAATFDDKPRVAFPIPPRAMEVEMDVEVDADAFRAMFSEFARAHRVLNRSEARSAAKMSEGMKALLCEQVKALARNAEGRAILWTYGADATPMLTQGLHLAKIGNRTIVRKVGEANEFLAERAFVKTTTPLGELLVAVVFRDPVPLKEGKTAWHEFTAMVDFFPLLRTLDHEGIIVSHGCFDRALQASMSRKTQQRAALYYDIFKRTADEEMCAKLSLLEL